MTFDEIIEAIPIEPYFRDPTADIVIYCADCHEILPHLPDKSIDLVLTDPPYMLGGKNDNTNILDVFAIMSLDKDILKDGAGILSFASQETLDSFMAMFRQLGWTWLNTIIWEHANTPTRKPKKFAISYDPILFYSKGELKYFDMDSIRVDYRWPERHRYPSNKNGKAWLPNPLGASRKDIWNFPAITSPSYTDEGVGHPWQKPSDLCEIPILACSQVNDLILDPFLGSGTTAYCAKKLNRKCIGIEIEPKYCEIAKNRLAQTVMSL